LSRGAAEQHLIDSRRAIQRRRSCRARLRRPCRLCDVPWSL